MMKASSVRFLVLVALWLGFSTAAMASLSWYDAAGALAAGVGTPSATHEEAERFRETMRAVVAEYDKIGAGELAQQCIDASRIVQIAENPSGWREILFLLAGLVSLIAALFITKILASMFEVEIAKLLWIPIGLLVAVFVAGFVAVRVARRRKTILAAGIALSAAGAVSVIDPLRHAFFNIVANVLLAFTAWFVPIVIAVISMAGLFFVASILMRHLGAGWWWSFLMRNLAGLVAIPFVCAFVFIGIMSFVGPYFFKDVSGIGNSDVVFSSYPNRTRAAAAEMARAAEGVYDGSLPQGAKPFGDFVGKAASMGIDVRSWNPANGILTTGSGLVAQILRKGAGWGGRETAVVFRGTASAKDGFEDVRQHLGTSTTRQYDEAVALVRAVRETTTGPLVLLGHSLGGGQAQYVLAMNGDLADIRGVGFNSAGLSAPSIGRIEASRGEGDTIRAAGAFSNIRMENDFVSSEGVLIGKSITVPSSGESGLSAHSITALAEAMERDAK